MTWCTICLAHPCICSKKVVDQFSMRELSYEGWLSAIGFNYKLQYNHVTCYKFQCSHQLNSRIYKEGLTERDIILCKLNRSLLESSLSVGIHRQKSVFAGRFLDLLIVFDQSSLSTGRFLDLVTVFNQSFNCQKSHCRGRNPDFRPLLIFLCYNSLVKLFSSMNVVISTNKRNQIYNRSHGL